MQTCIRWTVSVMGLLWPVAFVGCGQNVIGRRYIQSIYWLFINWNMSRAMRGSILSARHGIEELGLFLLSFVPLLCRVALCFNSISEFMVAVSCHQYDLSLLFMLPNDEKMCRLLIPFRRSRLVTALLSHFIGIRELTWLCRNQDHFQPWRSVFTTSDLWSKSNRRNLPPSKRWGD